MWVAGDLGLILDKTLKLEWHRTNNTRTRCLRITQKVCITPCLLVLQLLRLVHCISLFLRRSSF